MNILLILCTILWIYLLSVFHRGQLRYFEFLVGSVGFFLLSMWLIQPILLESLREFVASAAGAIGELFGFYQAFDGFHMLMVQPQGSLDSLFLYIDYECSGVIEMMAFMSMLLFFEVYTRAERVMLSLAGCLAIFLFNVLRLFAICIMIYVGGNDVYFIAHTIVGRVIFYVLTILLYYIVFTKAQVIKQKIGGFTYAKRHDHTKK